MAAVLASATPVAALDPDKQISQYVRLAWDSDRGLPQNSVAAIVQTPDGYIWLGTQEGLARFDGVRFTVFDRPQGFLPHNEVTALRERMRASFNPDGVMFYKVWNGRDKPRMPAFKSDGMTKDEAWTVVTYVKTFRK